MQILIPDSWLREYLETNATPKQIQQALSLCGPSIERLHEHDVYEIEVTTNRPDLMSVIGIAQEATAILPRFKHTAKLLKKPFDHKLTLQYANKVDYLQVKVDPELCFRFTAILIRDVQVQTSPKEIVQKLEQVGMRSLNNVVDISNLLMHETGQPVHTFDYDKIADHKMTLRESKKGEKLTTLDGKTHELPGGDIVIEDGDGRLIDLCGIMGGENSAVDTETKNILLFVQTYDSVHIRKTSMSLAHRTSAAVLFEKGLPIENVPVVLEMGVQLFKDLTGGKAEKVAIDIVNQKPIESQVGFKEPMNEFISSRLGVKVEQTLINDILSDLGFTVISDRKVVVPFRRKNDVTIPEDIVEEVARIYGYHNLPSELMTGALPTLRDDRIFDWEQKIKNWLSAWGYTETYTYSLVPEINEGSLKLKNPLTLDWNSLRTNLHDSHDKVIRENIGKAQELKLFEIANVYLPQQGKLPKEELRLIISSTDSDHQKIQGVVEALQDKMGTTLTGTGNPGDKFSYFEANLDDAIKRVEPVKKYIPISKFPALVEDINVTHNESYENIVKKIRNTSELIKDIQLIDKYGEKLTLRLTFHSDTRQLSGGDIAPIREKLLNLGIN